MLESLSKKIGFTQTEIKVVLFLIASLLLGLGIKFFLRESSDKQETYFDYSQQDSLFNLYSGMNPDAQGTDDTSQTLAEVRKEVLGVSEGNRSTTVKKELPEEKSININTATIDELTKLPGIGTKTAEKIIERRASMDGFKKLEDLLEVKGIGEVKFNNIKKFLYIK
jgi:competence protein ComEA